MPKTMPRLKTRYVCSNCGAAQMRWAGKCPECGEWNTLVEEVFQESRVDPHRTAATGNTPQKLSEIRAEDIKRLPLHIEEFSRVLGGGIVPGSLVLIGGEPGIGKCVTGDTRVFDPTSGAYLPITAWENTKRLVLSLDLGSRRLQASPALAFYNRGVRPVVELRTTLGRTLRCTPEHPVLTPHGWRAVSELRSGDLIGAALSLGSFVRDAVPNERSAALATRPDERSHIAGNARSAVLAAPCDPQCTALADSDVSWDSIASVRSAGQEAVYDLSVPGNENFVANDLIIHNSTLLLQAAVNVAQHSGTTLYVSGEESMQQLKMRAERLGVGDSELFLLTDTNLDNLMYQIESTRPQLAIIDSIQTMYLDTVQSSPGTVTQIRECAQRLQAMAKSTGIPIFIVGHVTKDGAIAGPKVLEHIVDTVLQLEGDRFHALRLLRSMKNRFGATSEVGVFEMAGSGMIEVTNPSEVFLAERMMNSPGSAIAVTMEGTRPLLVEVQALTSFTQNPMPRRTANGFDYNRLFILLAVLAKRVGLRLHDQDVFINVVGGMSIDEPAADLAVATAIASASKGVPVPADIAIIGEIGLSGELRSVGQLSARLNEVAKLGFKRCVIPKTARPVESPSSGLELVSARSLGEALDSTLGT